MNHGRPDVDIQVPEGAHRLHNNRPGLLFGYCLVLLQEKVQVVALAVLEDGAERIRVDLEHVKQLDNARVIKRLVNIVFSQCVSFI